jgi:hypothetical protein
VLPGGPALVRNYDWDYRLFDAVVARTAYAGRRVLGMLDCLWGRLDGVNDAALRSSSAVLELPTNFVVSAGSSEPHGERAATVTSLTPAARLLLGEVIAAARRVLASSAGQAGAGV